MRNIIIICLIILSSAFCFSQEIGMYGDFEFWGGFPFINGSLNHDGKETFNTQMPFSFGMGATNYKIFSNRNLGFAVSSNFIFPESLVHAFNGQETIYTQNDIFSIDMQLGLGYHLLGQEGIFRVPLTFGLHLLFIEGSLRKTSSETHELYINSLGLGASVAAELHINPLIYFFFRLQGFFDFFTLYRQTIFTGVLAAGKQAYYIDNREFTDFSTSFGLAPAIGIGIKVDGLFKNVN